MIDKPDTDAGVFLRLLRPTVVKGKGVEADGLFDGKAGDILILRWSDASDIVSAGDAEVV